MLPLFRFLKLVDGDVIELPAFATKRIGPHIRERDRHHSSQEHCLGRRER